MPTSDSTLVRVLNTDPAGLLQAWVAEQLQASTLRRDLLSEHDLRLDSQAFLDTLTRAVRQNPGGTLESPAWADLKAMLSRLSAARASQGFTSSEVATFVFSFKQPLFQRLKAALQGAPDELQDETWQATVLLDGLGLYTLEVYQRSREDIILRQRQELLELSTPVIKVWDGVVALPLIGTLDSERTQVVMESLLQRIVETESVIAILDITGVPTVDTLVAQHLLRAVAAAKLMGATCIISGIRPQIAQTIVHLGIDLTGVITKASFSDALALAMQSTGYAVASAPDQRLPGMRGA